MKSDRRKGIAGRTRNLSVRGRGGSSVAVALLLLGGLLLVVAAPAPAAGTPSITISPGQGPPGTPLTVTGSGFAPGVGVELLWWTWEGNRVSGSGFVPIFWSMATVTADGSGGFTYQFNALFDLGGAIAHKIEAWVAGSPVANATFTLTTKMWIEPTEGPEGTMIKFRMVGGGWTQYDNMVAVTYDNAFLGHACSFNSQGNESVWIQAIGAPGPHLIALWPNLFYGPSTGPTPWKWPIMNADDMPIKREPVFFWFNITSSTTSKSPSRNFNSGARDLKVETAPDGLVLPSLPAEAGSGGSPTLAVGNGAKGIVGGPLPYALSGLPANSQVELRWTTVTAVSKRSYDKFSGWITTPENRTLGSVQTGADGKATGSLTIPDDFGGDHILLALVGGEVKATSSFKVIPRFTASLDADGSHVILHATGLGWEQYTAGWAVQYDSKSLGWISAYTSRGTTKVSIPVVGTPGLHSITIQEGTGGWQYMNMWESPWPWQPVYRFSFVIPDTAPAPPLQPPTLTLPAGAAKAGVKGTVSMQGTAPAGTQMVQVKVGDGPWTNATGSSSWTLPVDTKAMADGPHPVRVRTADGGKYSEETVGILTVANRPAAGGSPSVEGLPVVWVGALLAVGVICGLAGYAAGGNGGTGKKRPGNGGTRGTGKKKPVASRSSN